jgi:hypothetical protein
MPDYPEPPTAGERLINCHTTNKGTEIQEIVKKSGNQVWKLRLSDVALVAIYYREMLGTTVLVLSTFLLLLETQDHQTFLHKK